MKGLGWLLVFAALGTTACGDSGQTGSPSCGPPQTCECAALADRVLVRATVLGVAGAQISLRIEEQLGTSADGSSLFVNKTLTGTLPVPGSCWPETNLFTAGDQVFAAFYTTDQCPAYYECAVDCYALPTSQRVDACLAECQKQCDQDTVFANPWLEPWRDSLAISPATTVTIADAVALSDRTTCEERFPPPPASPCLDTVSSGSGGCSLSRPAVDSDGASPAPAALLSLFGLSLWRRRRKRDTREITRA